MKINSLVCFLDNFKELTIKEFESNQLLFSSPLSLQNPAFSVLRFLQKHQIITFIQGENDCIDGINIINDSKIPSQLKNAKDFIKAIVTKTHNNTESELEIDMPFSLDPVTDYLFTESDMISTNIVNFTKVVLDKLALLAQIKVYKNGTDENTTYDTANNVAEIKIVSISAKGKEILKYFQDNLKILTVTYTGKRPGYMGTTYGQVDIDFITIRFLRSLEDIANYINNFNQTTTLFNNMHNLLNIQATHLDKTMSNFSVFNQATDQLFCLSANINQIPSFIQTFLNNIEVKGITEKITFSSKVQYKFTPENVKVLHDEWLKYTEHFNKLKASFLTSFFDSPTKYYEQMDKVFNPKTIFYLREFDFNIAMFHRLENEGILSIIKVDEELRTIEVHLNCNRPNLLLIRRLFNNIKLLKNIEAKFTGLLSTSMTGKTIVLNQEQFNTNQKLIKTLADNNIILYREFNDQHLIRIIDYIELVKATPNLQSQIAEEYILKADEGTYFALPKALLFFGESNNSSIAEANKLECIARADQKELARSIRSFLEKYSMSYINHSCKVEIFAYMRNLIASESTKKISVRNINKLVYTFVRMLYQPNGTPPQEFRTDLINLQNRILSITSSETAAGLQPSTYVNPLDKILKNKPFIRSTIDSRFIPEKYKKNNLTDPFYILNMPPHEILKVSKDNMLSSLRTYVDEIRNRQIMNGTNL